jgi:hypothetical protein
MTVDPHHLYSLLPTVYRTRDAERGYPLRDFLALLTDQVAVLDDTVAQLYDDLFVETASPWVLPYLAELIGLGGLPGERLGLTLRAEVANTIGYRRRKGTAAVLEQLARDVTGWPARAVEYFELLVGTQYVNHVRPLNHGTVEVRPAARLEFVGTAFERLAGENDLTHTVDVRRIANRRGRYDIPNVGIFLWRLKPYALTRSPAVPAEPALVHQRFFFSPLGRDTQLFTLPITEQDIEHLATPVNVPYPISRRMVFDDIEAVKRADQEGSERESLYYGGQSSGLDPSILIEHRIAGGEPEAVAALEIDVCDLSDDGLGGWHHTPPSDGVIAIDPVLGRIAFHDPIPPPLVSFHFGFSADIGGGEYDRVGSFAILDGPRVTVSQMGVADQQGAAAGESTVTSGLAALVTELDGSAFKSGAVEILDSGRYEETPAIHVETFRIEARAADGSRPTLVLDDELVISSANADAGELILNGLLIIGGPLRVPQLRRLRLRHCTLAPGLGVEVASEPDAPVTLRLVSAPGAVSLVVASPATSVEIDSCILGGLRINPDADVTIRNSIIDAGRAGIAYASDTDETTAGGRLTLENCTVLGSVHARVIALASNTIFLADPSAPDILPVRAEQRQEGCVRFSYLPAGSRTPRRHQCQPAVESDAARLRPVLTSSRYGDPGYCQLDRRTPEEITRGADDESEMGVFHDLFQPKRQAYLERRLNEYLRFGLEVGVFFAT